MGVFQSAAINILRQEDEAAAARKETDWKKELAISNPQRATTLLSRQEWVTAVIKGANDRSPRWKHLLVLGGLLVGFEGQERQGMSRHLRSTVESAFVKAMNLALDDVGMGEDLGAQSIALTLNWNFDLLSPLQRSMMDHDVSDLSVLLLSTMLTGTKATASPPCEYRVSVLGRLQLWTVPSEH